MNIIYPRQVPDTARAGIKGDMMQRGLVIRSKLTGADAFLEKVLEKPYGPYCSCAMEDGDRAQAQGDKSKTASGLMQAVIFSLIVYLEMF